MSAPTPLSMHYAITVPDGTSNTVVDVKLTCSRPWASSNVLKLAVTRRASPGLGDTLEYYGLHERNIQICVGGNEVPPLIEPVPESLYEWIRFEIPEGADDAEIVIQYGLDTARNQALAEDTIGQLYKDRVIAIAEYATVRGDTLLFPVTGPIESPGHVEGVPIDVEFAVELPHEGWDLAINAAATSDGRTIRWCQSLSGDQLLRGFRWFALGGDLLVRRLPNSPSEETVTHVLVTPTWNPVEDCLAPENALDIAEQVVADYDETFGIEMLGYLFADTDSGTIPGEQYVFLVPYPARARRGAGGFHAPGSAMVYVFFSRYDDPAGSNWLAHTCGHEYFHVYNDTALAASGDANSWFVEGYTEGQATLRDLKHVPPGRAKNQFTSEMGRQWALMQDSRREVLDHLRVEGLLVPERVQPGPAPLAWARVGVDVDDRSIRGRAFLLIHVMILIFESSRPRRRGFDDWFRTLFERLDPRTQREQPRYGQFRRAALDSAGEAAPMLDAFLARYVERNGVLGLGDLVEWLRWADEQRLFETLFLPEVEERDDPTTATE